MACNKCSCNTCCCDSSSSALRYGGPDIDELGIQTGDLLEVVIQYITNYITEGGSGAVSVLNNNGNGTYTHVDGSNPSTSVTFTTGLHTTAATAPSPLNTNYGDTWYDTTTNALRWYTNDGTNDVWDTATVLPEDRFKEETIHHNAVTVLAIDPSLHNKKEIHFESTGELSLDGALHLSSDDYTYLLVNTTALDRQITFSNVAGAFIRDGGAITDLSGTGITIPQNTTGLVTVTNSGGFAYINFHFYALEITGDPINTYNEVFDIVQNIDKVITVVTMSEAESILIKNDLGENITSGLNVTLIGDTITISSNVSLTDVALRVIYSI